MEKCERPLICKLLKYKYVLWRNVFLSREAKVDHAGALRARSACVAGVSPESREHELDSSLSQGGGAESLCYLICVSANTVSSFYKPG